MIEPATAPVPAKGLFARVLGVFLSPGVTYQSVVAHPKPVGILLLAILVIGVSTAGPQFTTTGRQLLLDTQVKAAEAGGRTLTEAQVATMEGFLKYAPAFTMVSVFVATPVFVMIFTLLYFLIFNVIMGGAATFKQVLTVVTHSSVIGAVGTAVGTPIMYAQGKLSTVGPFNLRALAVGADPDTFISHFLGAISVFQIWGIVVTAIGLAVLYRRKTGGIAVTLLVIYLAFTACMTYFFGKYMA
jgi:hypothetical protein